MVEDNDFGVEENAPKKEGMFDWIEQMQDDMDDMVKDLEKQFDW